MFVLSQGGAHMLKQANYLLDTNQSGRLDRIQNLLDIHQSRDSFIRLIRRYFLNQSQGYRLIMQAYDETLRDFENIKRDGGSPYFGHPEAVAIIVLEYLRISDANVIAAAILHDNVEDLTHLDWTHDRIRRSYNHTVANIVWWITKPKVSEYSGDKVRRDADYHTGLLSAPYVPIVVKLADRLHNVLTLSHCELEKRKRKIQETRDFYLLLAQKHSVLFEELFDAIIFVETGMNKMCTT